MIVDVFSEFSLFLLNKKKLTHSRDLLSSNEIFRNLDDDVDSYSEFPNQLSKEAGKEEEEETVFDVAKHLRGKRAARGGSHNMRCGIYIRLRTLGERTVSHSHDLNIDS